MVRALAEQEADVVLLQEVIDGGALGAALGLGQAADLTAALNTERAKQDVLRAQRARAPMSEPSPSYRCYAHSEPASYLTSGFGSFPPALSAVLFRYNPVWHCVQCGAALFNEIFLERLFGRHLMPAFESALAPLLFIGSGTAFVFGKASLVASNVPASGEPSTLRLGAWRTAQKLYVDFGGKRVCVVNVHLHSGRSVERIECRARQLRAVLEWVGSDYRRRRFDALIIGGDFNAPPTEPAYQLLDGRGFRSCHKVARGAEPDCTFPGIGSGLLSDTKDNDPAGVFDYIFVAGDVAVNEAKLFADAPCGGDTTLYPSDHYGLCADLTIGGQKDKDAALGELQNALDRRES